VVKPGLDVRLVSQHPDSFEIRDNIPHCQENPIIAIMVSKTFEGKVILITGAASGMGRTTTLYLAARGASLSLADIATDGLDETVRLTNEAGHNVEILTRKVDVSKPQDVEGWVLASKEKFGKIDGCLNAAGTHTRLPASHLLSHSSSFPPSPTRQCRYKHPYSVCSIRYTRTHTHTHTHTILARQRRVIIRGARADTGPGTRRERRAGLASPHATIPEARLDDFDRVIAVNLRGVFNCLKYQLPRIQDGGSIVNMGSVLGLYGVPNYAPYVASKFGVVGLSKSAAFESADRGVRVNSVCP
jgi:NAD(P)-dependent dehydrogenase (short-subunit alcohol dehydrogenase family)